MHPGYGNIARLLVKSGADVNAVNEDMDSAFVLAIFLGILNLMYNLFGTTWLINQITCPILEREVAEFLLQSGANVSTVQPRYYNTLLNFAAKTGN